MIYVQPDLKRISTPANFIRLTIFAREELKMTQNRWHFSRSAQAKLRSRLSPLSHLLFLIVIATSTVSRTAEPEEIRLYIDADFTNAQSSSISIEQGIKTALSEENNMLGVYPGQVVRKDHRGNTRRSRNNLVDYSNDDRALVVFCGLHSPPVLANLEYINTMGVLLLDPWAAAGPITLVTQLLKIGCSGSPWMTARLDLSWLNMQLSSVDSTA